MPRELDALVKKLKKRKGVDNPFALARSILGSDASIMRKRRKAHGGKPKGSRGRS